MKNPNIFKNNDFYNNKDYRIIKNKSFNLNMPPRKAPAKKAPVKKAAPAKSKKAAPKKKREEVYQFTESQLNEKIHELIEEEMENIEERIVSALLEEADIVDE